MDHLLDLGLQILLVMGLVLLNGFFVAAEFAIVKVRASQVALLPPGTRRAAANHILEHVDAYISACQLGVTIASLALGWIGEPVVAELLVEPLFGAVLPSAAAIEGVSFGIAFALVTAVLIVVGELAPKYWGIREPLRAVMFVALPLRLFLTIFKPLIWALNVSANALVKVMGIKPVTEGAEEHSLEELRVLLAQVPAEDGAARQSAEIAARFLALREMHVSDAMMPRDRVAFVDVRLPFEENLRSANENPFTRFPLVDGSPDSVLGFVHHRDILAAAKQVPRPALDKLRRPVGMAWTGQPLSAALFNMLERQRHVTIVVDDEGNTAGMLTLEDILEQVVGEIKGEFDTEERKLRLLAPGRYEVDASIPLKELQLVLREPIQTREASTLAGLLGLRLGRAAVVGDRIEIGQYEYEVTAVNLHGVDRVEIRRIPVDGPS